MTATPYKPAGSWGAKRPLAGKCRAALHKLQILLPLLMGEGALAEGTPSWWLVRPLEDRVYFRYHPHGTGVLVPESTQLRRLQAPHRKPSGQPNRRGIPGVLWTPKQDRSLSVYRPSEAASRATCGP